MIEPVHCLAMFFAKLTADPYDHASIEAGCIGEELTKMRMIGSFQLILYDHEFVASQVPRNNIGREIPY